MNELNNNIYIEVIGFDNNNNNNNNNNNKVRAPPYDSSPGCTKVPSRNARAFARALVDILVASWFGGGAGGVPHLIYSKTSLRMSANSHAGSRLCHLRVVTFNLAPSVCY